MKTLYVPVLQKVIEESFKKSSSKLKDQKAQYSVLNVGHCTVDST